MNSCKKEVNSIGIDMRDDLLGTDFIDTVTLKAYSLLEDSLNTTFTNVLLGELHDPIFGQTKSAIYMQLVLDKEIKINNANEALDSIVLVLSYTGGYKGDTLDPVAIKVYKLSEDLNNTTTYYQFSTLTHDNNNLTYHANYQTCFKPSVNVKVGSDTISRQPHLRVRLTDNLKSDLMRSMSSTNDLRTTLKGLCIEATSSGASGCMGYFRMNNDYSGIILYTHRTDTTLNYQYTFSTKGTQDAITYFTHFEHDYDQSTDPQFKQMVLAEDHSIGEQVLYLQANGGVRTKIELPYLANLFKDQNVIINRAELIIANMLPEEVLFEHPNSLSLKYIGTDGSLNTLADENLGASFWGGVYDKDKQEYRIRLTRYVQSILKGVVQNKGLYLMTSNAAISSARLKFYGTDPVDLTKRLRMEISYTTY